MLGKLSFGDRISVKWLAFESKIAAATGHKTPNPWDPGDAFMASAIYLSELGADSRDGERTAAAKYFAGGNWKSGKTGKGIVGSRQTDREKELREAA